jgi:hypothetical protein
VITGGGEEWERKRWRGEEVIKGELIKNGKVYKM